MKFSESVERAIYNAAPLEQVDGQWVSPQTYDPKIALNVPRTGNHNFPVVFPDHDKIIYPSYYVLTDNLEDLSQSVDEYHRQLNIPLNQHLIDNELYHESQHQRAAVALGALGCFYGLRVSKNETAGATSWMVGTIPTDLTTTKAGLAAINAHPDIPSPSDMAQIRDLGYARIDDVTKVAKRYGLPIPLSTRTV